MTLASITVGMTEVALAAPPPLLPPPPTQAVISDAC